MPFFAIKKLSFIAPGELLQQNWVIRSIFCDDKITSIIAECDEDI